MLEQLNRKVVCRVTRPLQDNCENREQPLSSYLIKENLASVLVCCQHHLLTRLPWLFPRQRQCVECCHHRMSATERLSIETVRCRNNTCLCRLVACVFQGQGLVQDPLRQQDQPRPGGNRLAPLPSHQGLCRRHRRSCTSRWRWRWWREGRAGGTIERRQAKTWPSLDARKDTTAPANQKCTLSSQRATVFIPLWRQQDAENQVSRQEAVCRPLAEEKEAMWAWEGPSCSSRGRPTTPPTTPPSPLPFPSLQECRKIILCKENSVCWGPGFWIQGVEILRLKCLSLLLQLNLKYKACLNLFQQQVSKNL